MGQRKRTGRGITGIKVSTNLTFIGGVAREGISCRLETFRLGLDSLAASASMIFPSKRDWWLILILVGTVVAEVGAGVLVLVKGPEVWPAILLFLAALFIWWLMRSTYYVVGETDLVIRCGPFRWTCP